MGLNLLSLTALKDLTATLGSLCDAGDYLADAGLDPVFVLVAGQPVKITASYIMPDVWGDTATDDVGETVIEAAEKSFPLRCTAPQSVVTHDAPRPVTVLPTTMLSTEWLAATEAASFDAAPDSPGPRQTMAETPEISPTVAPVPPRVVAADGESRGGGVGSAAPAVDARPMVIKGSPWSEEDDQRAVALAALGVKRREIAADLGRTYDATCFRLKEVLNHRIDAAKVKATPLRPLPPAQVAAPPQPEPAAPGDRVVPQWQRELWVRLDRLGLPAPFTAGVDLEIMTRQTHGERASDIAADLGIDLPVLRQRVIALLPVTGMEAQARLVAELRARASA